MMLIPLPTESDTARLARDLAPHLGAGDVLALYGPLGSGKTFFTRELCRAMGFTDRVNSPTFVIRNDYDAPVPVRHFDLYRLTADTEVEELGLDEDFEHTITVIEWPERAEWLLPPGTLRLRFAHAGTGREVQVDAPRDLPLGRP